MVEKSLCEEIADELRALVRTAVLSEIDVAKKRILEPDNDIEFGYLNKKTGEFVPRRKNV